MTRRVVPLTRDLIGDLPVRCRSCVFWELDPVTADRVRADGSAARAKAQWLAETLRARGGHGWVVLVDDSPAAYAITAPPAQVPRATAFATSPVAADAALLTTLHVAAEHRGHGLGKFLVQTVAKDLLQRDVHAIEAFAELRPGREGCLIPAGFLLAVGFKTVRPHVRHPRLRLDLRSTVTWRDDVEGAFERLLGAIARPALGALPMGARGAR